jgi:DNA-directed RNA polymerase subunit RPC12/RpoP
MTSQPLPTPTEFQCTQCNGVLHPDEGQLFLTCPYCGSAVYLDKSKVVFHWSLARTLTPEAAQANLFRWMAGNHTVKDLDKKSRVVSTTFQYFPLWYVKEKDEKTKKENIFIEPAAATSISEIKSLQIPSGDLQKYDPSLDLEAVAPTVPFPAMLKWLEARDAHPQEIAEAALVHLPVYIFKYQYQGQVYTAMIEGSSGKVFANLFPAKAEAPYYIVAVVAVAGFLCISSFPVVGFLTGEEAGMGLGMLACLVAGAVFAIPVFALAAFVSAKV